MSFGDAPHKFEPKMFQGKEQLSCNICGFLEDNFRHKVEVDCPICAPDVCIGGAHRHAMIEDGVIKNEVESATTEIGWDGTGHFYAENRTDFKGWQPSPTLKDVVESPTFAHSLTLYLTANGKNFLPYTSSSLQAAIEMFLHENKKKWEVIQKR